VHGQGTDKYDNVRIGMNSRLDTIQAAILIEKMRIFPDEIKARNQIAARYNECLRDVVLLPEVPEGLTSTWAQFTIRLPDCDRNGFQRRLYAAGIPSAIYYRRPLHQQIAYSHCPVSGTGLPISERLAETVVSLPMHPYLTEADQDRIVSAVRDALSTRHSVAAE
jgi:dTDP-4-amino-4,6-dideoxygalactose transaminase